MARDLEDLIPLERYPIDDLDGRGDSLVERCRRELHENALCCLPGFLTDAALGEMQAEILAASHRAYWIESDRTVYSWRDLSALPAEHPARATSRHRLGSVTRDAFAPDGALLSLFGRDELTEFVRRCLGFDTLSRVECPYLSMNVKVMPQGARHGWHFDTNDGAVSLLVQAARAGGCFEYVPYIRSEADERYEDVARVVRGDRAGVMRVDIAPGTFCLFMGHRSLHRVSEVTGGDPDRLIAIYSYDRRAGLVYNENVLRTVLGAVPSALA